MCTIAIIEHDARIVSAISAVPRKPGRFSIAANGKTFATLSTEAIQTLGIRIGINVEPLMDRIVAEDARLRVYDRALNMLAFRARSAAELRRSLARKGDDNVAIDAAVDRLVSSGLLNDADFAASYARAKILGAKQSRRRVSQSLMRKGVARDVTDAALSRLFEEENIDQRDLVIDAARKKLRGLSKHVPLVRKRRLYAFLARRGYDMNDILEAMRQVRHELSA